MYTRMGVYAPAYAFYLYIYAYTQIIYISYLYKGVEYQHGNSKRSLYRCYGS